MSDAAGWNVQQHYETIHFANIEGGRSATGHSTALLFGIGPSGVEIWKFDPGMGWSRPSAAYPTFENAGLSAYQYLSHELTLNTDLATDDIRTVYAFANPAAVQTWHDSSLPGLARPAGTTPADWAAVKDQILTELGFVINVDANDNLVHTYQSDLEQFKNLKLDFVSGLLQADNFDSYNAQAAWVAAVEAQNAQANALVGGLVGAVGTAFAIGGIPIGPILSAGYAIFTAFGGSQIWNQTVSGPVFDSAIYVQTSALKSYLSDDYGDFIGAQALVHDLVISDYGLLQALGDEIDWPAVTMNQLQQRSVDAFTLWCWQTLTPLIWNQKYESPGGSFSKFLDNHHYPQDAAWKFSSGKNGFWIRAKSPGNDNVVPQSGSLHNIFDAPNIDDDGVNRGGLGVPVWDVFLRCDGWNLPGGTVSNAASMANHLCGGMTTPQPGAPEPAPPSSTPDDSNPARIVITAERTSLENGLMTMQIGIQNRTNATISHVEVTEAKLTLPGIGRRSVPPIESLPSRRRRMRRGGWSLLDLTFPIPVNLSGKATLQVKGTYAFHRPDGRLQQASFGASWRFSQ